MTTPKFAQRMDFIQPNAVGELLKFGADPQLMSFAGGYPDASLFPAKALNEVYSRAILDQGPKSLQYTVSDGDPALRAQLAARITALGTPCETQNILILQGSQQGLDLVGKLMLDPGDVVVTENPTFLGALIAFNAAQPRYVGIPLDENGMVTDELERQLKASLRPKFLYTIPDFQNPTGVTLSAPRRQHLMSLANDFDFIILEDTAYRELRYEGEAPPTLKSMDREGRVIMLGSFSKILAPGLRLGWSVASETITEKLGLLKLAADTQCSTLNMAAASLFMQHHDLNTHVETLKSAYRRKRNVMLQTIRQTFPQEVKFTEPQGGLFTWLTFPKGFDTTAFMRAKALPLAKVAYVPGASFFPVEIEDNRARFNFSGQPDDVIVKGITALAQFVKQEIAKT